MKDVWKDKPKVKRMEEKMLSKKTTLRVSLHEGCALGEGDGSNEEGYG